MADLRIAQVGCGGMGLRHAYGEIELKRVFGTFDLTAVCDVNLSAAEHVANEAEKGLGKRPAVYTDFDRMLDEERGLDALDIVTDAGQHHVQAFKAFEAGVHVAVEKPMGLTVRACRKMIDAAERSGLVLSVSENFRRDPMNRLVRAILEARALGDPRLFLDISTAGSRFIAHSTAWRHVKVRGGYLLDYAVHNADLLLYFLGEVERVYAETHLWEKVRYSSGHTLSGKMAEFYAHRVKEDFEKEDTIECTSEDIALALVRFKSGAVAQFGKSLATPGEPTSAGIVYCADGSLKLPGARSGRPALLTKLGEPAPMTEDEVLELVPQFELDDRTAALFDGSRRLSSYEMPYERSDAKLIALELQEFGEAILSGRQPEVTGAMGLDAVALTFAILESGSLNEPVSLVDVAADRVNGYQREINESVGL